METESGDAAPRFPRKSPRAVLVVLVLTAGLVVTGIAIAFHRYENTSRIVAAYELALTAAELRELRPEDAALLGAAAVSIQPDEVTRASLADTLFLERRSAFSGTVNVEAVAISADGRLAVTSDLETGVKVWTLVSGMSVDATDIAALKGQEGWVTSIALTPDGKVALTGISGGSVIVWDLTDPRHPVKVASIVGDVLNQVEEVALSEDGRTAVAGTENGDVTLWDLTRKSHPVRLSALRAAKSRVSGLAMSADGRTLVTAAGGSGIVWDVADQARPVRLATLDRPGSTIEGVALSADGRTALVGGLTDVDRRNGAHVWDLSTPARPVHLATLPARMSEVYNVALAADGKTAMTSGFGGLTMLWDLRDRSRPVRTATLKGPATLVNRVAMAASGTTAMMATPRWGAFIWNIAGVGEDPLRTFCESPRYFRHFDRQWWDLWMGGHAWPSVLDDAKDVEPCSQL
ncbi:WD40 repeat domain-containing protein [Microbispora siamensis]|uniref:WD40 repeat domain-containing protein n=1 Tax=Microbispora siamensis TaxID=564413 RepID=A0ABQ4GTT7_9ACTN|nr:hypothetical protein [Microbispora siamensis]GIH64858.1 hypothetical protein Msi02_56750 [Microbispora siamensis]